MTRWHWVTLLAVLFVVPGNFAATKPQWICAESKDFAVVSDATEKDTRLLAVRLEAFRSVLSRIFGLRRNSDRPLTVMAFRDWESFRDVESYGLAIGEFMDRGAEDIVIMVMLNQKGIDPEQTLLHEYTHVLTSTSIHDWPPWLREGIAEVYSTFKIDGNKVILGLPIESRLTAVRNEASLIPTTSLIKQAPKGHDVWNAPLFYAQAWALSHYLMFAEKRVYADKLFEYARRCEAGKDSEQIFREVFQTDPKTFDKKLADYIRQQEFPGLTIEYDNLSFDKELKVHPLSEADLDACYGNILLNATDYERRHDFRSIKNEEKFKVDPRHRAEVYFRDALKRDPKCARAYEGYAFLNMLRENYKVAQQQYRDALKLRPDHAESHYLFAMALYGDYAGFYDYAKEIPPDQAADIFEEARTALKLKPTYADCYDVFARLCLNPGESLDEGLRLIDSAIHANPRTYLFQLTRGELLYRKGDYVAARKALTTLIEDDENVPYKVRASAQRILDQVQSDEHRVKH